MPRCKTLSFLTITLVTKTTSNNNNNSINNKSTQKKNVASYNPQKHFTLTQTTYIFKAENYTMRGIIQSGANPQLHILILTQVPFKQ